jgi:hypothetical protein
MVESQDKYWLFWATETVGIIESAYVVTYCNIYCRPYEMFLRG